MKLLYLKFDDPASLEDEHTKEEALKILEDTISFNEAVGWLLKEDKTHYYITPHMTPFAVSSSLKVPKSIVSKKKVLKI